MWTTDSASSVVGVFFRCLYCTRVTGNCRQYIYIYGEHEHRGTARTSLVFYIVDDCVFKTELCYILEHNFALV